MPLTITYVHAESCERHDQKVVIHPFSDNGVTYLQVPICEETMVELLRVSVERD